MYCPVWYLPFSVTCGLLSALSLMCCTCVPNYLPCSCVFKPVCFTLSCLLLALFFPQCLISPLSFLLFSPTPLLVCSLKNNNKPQCWIPVSVIDASKACTTDGESFHMMTMTWPLLVEANIGEKRPEGHYATWKCQLAALLGVGIKETKISDTNQNTLLPHGYPFCLLNLWIWPLVNASVQCESAFGLTFKAQVLLG